MEGLAGAGMRRASTTISGCLTALPLLLALAAPARAQDAPAADSPAPAPASPAPVDPQIDFAADQVNYDSERDVVIAEGQVRMNRDGTYLAADKVTWTRATGDVIAEGHVVVLNPQGDKLIGDRVKLTDTLRSGTVDNLLVVLDGGGRIAAREGSRDEAGRLYLKDAYYTACPVTGDQGCPKRPSWSIRAARVTQDPATGRVRFSGGRLTLFGLDLPLLPIFSVSVGRDQAGMTGVLFPDLSVSRFNGFEFALPYHLQIAPNRDATIKPHLYTGAPPALEGQYRQLTSLGAFQLGGFVTYGDVGANSGFLRYQAPAYRGVRGFVEGNGRFQFTPRWSLTTAVRAATDKTVTRRYDLTRDTQLRNFVNAERIDADSYVTVAGWVFQGLRADDIQNLIPIALPAVDARFKLRNVGGGTAELQANSLFIRRPEGQDTQRAFASARWDMRRLTPFGQELTLTALARADAYHSDDNFQNPTAGYAGLPGWQHRGIALAAADLRWPLVGSVFGGQQQFTPRVQLVATPKSKNEEIPNEDSRAIDLEDSNLFALNRFPGYDRFEDGSRITYGADWAFDRPKLSIRSTVGQSYRVRRDRDLFPDGTGLTDRLSDIVGRTRVRWRDWLDVTHRFRLDKDNLAVRRNEVDLTVGGDETYALIGYLKLNRNIPSTTEDLRDKEELRLAGRMRFARYWSVFGATVLDLSGKDEDPLSLADGFEPVRHRLGLAYEDDCLELGVQWKRDYDRLGSYRSGNRFSLHLALRGLGR